MWHPIRGTRVLDLRCGEKTALPTKLVFRSALALLQGGFYRRMMLCPPKPDLRALWHQGIKRTRRD